MTNANGTTDAEPLNGMYQDEHKKTWYKDGKPHREDGPAVIWNFGATYWWFEGKLHRDDGPAVNDGGLSVWWYHGKLVDCATQEEFERLIKLRMLWE